MRDNDRSYDTDYALANREFRPPARPPVDFRTYAVIIGGILIAYFVLFILYSLWKLFYCWSIAHAEMCYTINEREPFFVVLLIALPVAIIAIDHMMRVWTRTRYENAVANRTNLVLNRYGDTRPADLYDRIPIDALIKMLMTEYASAEAMETSIARYKQLPRGLNTLSGGTNNYTYGDTVEAEDTPDPLALLPTNGDDPIMKTLIQRGLVDRSGNSLLVGLSAQKPHYIELDETGLIGIAGMPRVGKSATATFLIAQLALMNDSITIVCDKHGKKDSSLLNRLGPIAHTFERTAIEPADIMTAIDYWYEIGANRLAEDNPRQYPPATIVIDEFTALVLLDILSASALHRLLSGGVEFPKVQCYGVIIGHQWTGKLLGTFGAPMRRAMTQRIIHRIDPQDAGFMINASAAKQVLSLPDGAAIIQGATNPSPVEVRVPYLTMRDLEYIARLLPAAPTRIAGPSGAVVSAVSSVSSASQSSVTDANDPPDAATVDPADYATDPRTIVAKQLLAKRSSNGSGWQYTYRQVATLTKLRTSVIVSIAAIIGRGNGRIV
jgi:hypothetical protein